MSAPGSALHRSPAAIWQFFSAAPYLLPALLVFVIFTYYPLGRVIYMSFTDADLLRPTPNFVGLANYKAMLLSADFWAIFRNTAIFGIGVTLIEVVLGMSLAFLMNAKTRVQGLVRGAVFTPVVVSIAATALIWNYLLNPTGGPVNDAIRSVGLPAPGWLADPSTALASLILIAVWKGVGLPAVLYLAGLQGIPRELEEAAVVDGANRWEIAWKIIVPMLAPTTALVFFISLAGTFQSYGLVLLMTQGGPVGATNLLGYYIYQNAFQYFQMGFASALSVTLFVILLVVGYVQLRIAERRVHYQ
ncbi:carbohydrate ABC transporter permease [Deinococcus peraridilitoris]|uniref:Permease component of ABC-type sugar transporter n=1 Tax=Deinococcus peraridilitoris (strain DSM 19664 / LMG 22246 / CIP 109416 / KR-200) TaxID=937777 RepID=L0A0B8_DEIPD|nr:sugar ABC transporter permease [Deinococcus peraridilitoris]AFZ66904.1 permease component of ABC-type sugar transporter [Deinococcus peraridilitoris DSM 19664]